METERNHASQKPQNGEDKKSHEERLEEALQKVDDAEGRLNETVYEVAKQSTILRIRTGKYRAHLEAIAMKKKNGKDMEAAAR